MQFEVPQFIEIEDKIVGPLTWKQFVYTAGGVGLMIILYVIFQSFLVFVFLGLPIGGIAISLAFIKINSRPFSIIMEAAIRFFTGARLYIWQRSATPEIVVKTEKEDTVPLAMAPSVSTGHIADLSQKLEHGSSN